jgi:hypothetical protein
VEARNLTLDAQKIEHAGYTRFILERNPRRYNEYGEELDDSESDQEADEDAADENAYTGIRLEGAFMHKWAEAQYRLTYHVNLELLCPLKHPSELPVHPTMSHPYLSTALPDMVKSTQDKLRQERANLWRAKHLNRQLIGDESWMPCGAVESPDDWDLFEPRKKPLQEPNGVKKRKREGTSPEDLEGGRTAAMDQPIEAGEVTEATTEKDVHEPSSAPLTGCASAEPGQDLRMPDAGHPEELDTKAHFDVKGGSEPRADKTEEEPEDVQMDGAAPSNAVPELNGIHPPDTSKNEDAQHVEDRPDGAMDAEENQSAETPEENVIERSPKPVSEPDDATPPPPPRRITRALAANNNSNPHSTAVTPSFSPTPTLASSSTSSLLHIDPIFLLPPSVHPSGGVSALYTLPAEEAAETRRLLATYIQKQEESVRGYESVLAKLLKAQRLRDEVLEMCKAEGHVGEMSDGEDWIDYEQWGLQPGELRKGRDDDEDAVEENTIGGRKGKRRARN